MQGGVGKSTLTYHIATEFAFANPRRNVVVVDMCPQSNASDAFLRFALNWFENILWVKKMYPRKSEKTVKLRKKMYRHTVTDDDGEEKEEHFRKSM